MIDIDYTEPSSIVRANIGDPDTEFVSENTITSALTKTGNDVNKSSILIMEALLSYFSTQADLERTAQVEYEYKKLYERYKNLLKDFKAKNGSKYTSGIIIGGTSLKEVNRVNNDKDSMTMWLQDTYQDLMLSDKVIRDNDYLQD